MPQIPAVNQSKWESTLAFVSQELGVTKAFLRDFVIPAWVHPADSKEADQVSAALRDLALVLRVPTDRLTNQTSPLVLDVAASRCKGTLPEMLSQQKPARIMAEVLGRHLVGVLDDEAWPRLFSADQLRALLLNSTEVIDLDALTNLCWDLNIPVAHLSKAPTHAPHAMAINVDGRCAIVLIRNQKHQGWHLFDLAHELGHVMLGHVKPGEAIVDGAGINLDQSEEDEANQFAFQLLTGSPMGLSLSRVTNAERLLQICLQASPRYCVDPQWLIVCIGYNWPTTYWGVCVKALGLGWPDNDAPKLVELLLLRQLKKREVGRMRLAMIRTFAVREAKAA